MAKKKKDTTPTDTDAVEFITVNGIKGILRGDIVSAMIPVDLINPVDWNTNVMDEYTFALLKETILESGFIDPISVIPSTDGKFDINGGEHRWKVVKELGIRTIPCDILHGDKWKDVDQQKFQSVRSNVLHGEMNPDKFLKLYNDMVDKYGRDQVVGKMGYTNQNGIDRVVKNISKQMKSALPPEMAKKFEKKAKEAKTVGEVEKVIKHLFQEHGDSIKYNFMVFAWGGKEHVYIAMDKNVHNSLKKIMSASRDGERDINELIGNAIKSAAESISGKKDLDEDGPEF